MPELRVATFNIRTGLALDGWHSWPFRKRVVLRTIEALDADVVALQEARCFQVRWLRRRLPDHDVVWTGRNGGHRGEACPVFVRRSTARILSDRTLWLAEGLQRPGLRLEGARSPRIATTCRIELMADGAVLDVTNTHLDASSATRRHRGAQLLVAALDRSVPHVVLGDLNAEPGSTVLSVFAAAGLRDALAGTAGGTFHDFTGRLEGPRIDYALVDDSIQVVETVIVHEPGPPHLASDHWPVRATLRLT